MVGHLVSGHKTSGSGQVTKTDKSRESTNRKSAIFF